MSSSSSSSSSQQSRMHAAGAARPMRRGVGAAGASVLPLVLLAFQIAVGSPAGAQTPAAAWDAGHAAVAHTAVAHTTVPELAFARITAADPAAPGPRAPLAATVTEGQVKEVAPGGVITYPSVTSCLTVTVRLRGGGLVGAHASLFQVPGELRSDEILPALKSLVGGRPVSRIEVRGAVGAWHPSYFMKAIESYADGEAVPVPSGQDFDGLARAVADGLGRARHVVTVQDVPDGDQIIR
ncbi:hypothetical protein [Streptomyces sp. NBC_01431]|uniref:hypothetical protein n=1 Tax=Streptomyces sp. NBC_01431 TaxID=2903863 RepID=UPI002E3626D5|nr:hypothetical protein [Streptomyces sp. NBC_01431]